MSTVIQRLGSMSTDMHSEINTQTSYANLEHQLSFIMFQLWMKYPSIHHRMINDLNAHTDATSQRIAMAQQKMERLMETAGCTTLSTMLFLGLAIMVLVFLIIYT